MAQRLRWAPGSGLGHHQTQSGHCGQYKGFSREFRSHSAFAFLSRLNQQLPKQGKKGIGGQGSDGGLNEHFVSWAALVLVVHGFQGTSHVGDKA